MKNNAWKYALTGLAGLLLGLWLFLPWNAIGDYAVEKMLEKASERQVYATVASHTTEGFLRKTLVLRGVRVDYPVMSVSVRDFRITPHMLSLLTAHQKIDVTLGRGELTPVTRQSLVWDSGTMRIVRSSDDIVFEEIDIRGAFSAKGSIAFAAATGKPSKADLTITLPTEMDRALQMLSTTGMLPLRKVNNGEWRVER